MNFQPTMTRTTRLACHVSGLLLGSLCGLAFAASSPDEPPAPASDVGAVTAPGSATVQRGYRHHEAVHAPVAPASHPSTPQAQVFVLNSNVQKQARIGKR